MIDRAHDDAVDPSPTPATSPPDGTATLSKPERILAAAERLFADTGHASLTVEAIAREAGVSRGLLHYYFGSMEDILAQVVRRNAETSLETTGQALEQATTRDELIGALMGAFRTGMTARPSVYALYYETFVQARVHEQVRDELATLYQRRRQTLAAHLADAEGRGVVTLPHGAEVTAAVVISLADGAALQYLSDPSMPVAEVQAAATATFAVLLTG